MKPRCAGCGGKVKRPVHRGSKASSIYCSAACRKGTLQLAHVSAVTNAQLGIYIEPKEELRKTRLEQLAAGLGPAALNLGESAQLAAQAMDGLASSFIAPKPQTFSIGIDKPGLVAGFESRLMAGDEVVPRLFAALDGETNPHEWAFNRNQEVYWCPKCGAQIDLRLVQHFRGAPDELFKGRCRGLPTVEQKAAAKAVAEKLEASITIGAELAFVGHDPMEDLQHGGHDWTFKYEEDIFQCRKCKAFYRSKAHPKAIDFALKSPCPEWAQPGKAEEPGRVINFDEEK